MCIFERRQKIIKRIINLPLSSIYLGLPYIHLLDFYALIHYGRFSHAYIVHVHELTMYKMSQSILQFNRNFRSDQGFSPDKPLYVDYMYMYFSLANGLSGEKS